MKKLHVFLLLLGLAFLGYLLWRLGLRPIWNELSTLGWGLAAFIAMEFVAEAIHTVAWSNCLGKPYCQLPWTRRFNIRLAGNAINYLTPTAAVGGELSKAGFLSSNLSDPKAIGGVVTGRLCAGIGHFVFVAVGSVMVVCFARLAEPVWMAMFISGSLVAAGILAFLVLQKNGKLGAVVRWLATRKFAGKKLEAAAREITRVDESLKLIYRERPGDIIRAVCWHLAGHATGFIQTWCFFYFLHQSVPVRAIATVWFLGMWFDLLTFAVPLNMGTLEGGRLIAFKAVGLSAVLGMTYGVALRLAQLSCAAFGLLAYTLLFREHSKTQNARRTIRPAKDVLKREEHYAHNKVAD